MGQGKKEDLDRSGVEFLRFESSGSLENGLEAGNVAFLSLEAGQWQ